MQQPCEVPCFGRSRPERAMFARHNVDKTRLIATKSPNELLIPNATKVCLSHAPEVPLNRGNHISSMGKAVGIESANGPFNTCGWPRMTSFSESDTLQKPHRTHPTRKSGETMLATLGTNATSKFFPTWILLEQNCFGSGGWLLCFTNDRKDCTTPTNKRPSNRQNHNGKRYQLTCTQSISKLALSSTGPHHSWRAFFDSKSSIRCIWHWNMPSMCDCCFSSC